MDKPILDIKKSYVCCRGEKVQRLGPTQSESANPAANVCKNGKLLQTATKEKTLSCVAKNNSFEVNIDTITRGAEEIHETESLVKAQLEEDLPSVPLDDMENLRNNLKLQLIRLREKKRHAFLPISTILVENIECSSKLSNILYSGCEAVGRKNNNTPEVYKDQENLKNDTPEDSDWWYTSVLDAEDAFKDDSLEQIKTINRKRRSPKTPKDVTSPHVRESLQLSTSQCSNTRSSEMTFGIQLCPTNDDIGGLERLSPFTSEILEKFLAGDTKLNVSYEIPKSGAEAGIREKIIDYTPMMKNIFDFKGTNNKPKESSSVKAKTVAQKREILERQHRIALKNHEWVKNSGNQNCKLVENKRVGTSKKITSEQQEEVETTLTEDTTANRILRERTDWNIKKNPYCENYVANDLDFGPTNCSRVREISAKYSRRIIHKDAAFKHDFIHNLTDYDMIRAKMNSSGKVHEPLRADLLKQQLLATHKAEKIQKQSKNTRATGRSKRKRILIVRTEDIPCFQQSHN